MTVLHQAVEDYLATRRALGFKLDGHDRLLHDFVANLAQKRQATITIDAAVAWARYPAAADPYWWARRMAVVRGFARWWSAFDADTQVPPADVLPAGVRRAEPYPYTDDDLAALMSATSTIHSPLKAATYRTLIGLLAVTGMRVGEAIRLDRNDVCWDDAYLIVRHSKFDKSREVMLHPTTITALRRYANVRDRHLTSKASAAFLLSLSGTRLIYNNVHFTFHQLVQQVGLTSTSHRCRPRIHDLRHRFATQTLLRWYREGDDLEVRLPQLSTYLGHVAPSDTYWYLHATPELLSLAAQRVEAAQTVSR